MLTDFIFFFVLDCSCPLFNFTAKNNQRSLWFESHQQYSHNSKGFYIKNYRVGFNFFVLCQHNSQDEAHNLLETISSINSKTISAQQLRTALLQITQYQQKYQNRLSAKSVLPIKQLLFFISQLSKFAGESSNKNLEEGKHTRTANFTDDGNNVHEEVIYDCSQFCMETGVDHLNIRTLLDFCEKSKFQHKLMNFKPEISVSSANALTEFVGKKKLNKNEVDTRVSEESQNVLHEKDSNGSPLANILDFMRCLLNENDDGRILCVKKIHPSESFFKYVLLNPGSLFKEFVTEPRYIVIQLKVNEMVLGCLLMLNF